MDDIKNWGVGVWDTQSGEILARLKHPDMVCCSRFSPNKRFVLTACRDGQARLWDWRRGEVVATAHHDCELLDAQFFGSSQIFVTAARDGVCRIWDASIGLQIGSGFQTKQNPTFAVHLKQGKMIACGEGPMAGFDIPSPALLDVVDFYSWCSGRRWLSTDQQPVSMSTDDWVSQWESDRPADFLRKERWRRMGEVSPVSTQSPQPTRNKRARNEQVNTVLWSKPKIQRSEVAEILMSDKWTWDEPVRLPDTVNSQHNEYEPFVTVDGLELYFSSDRPGGQGEFDLYLCRRKSLDDDWGPAENLGQIVNSIAIDKGAFVTSDGLSMYFNSDRSGVMDMYVCRRASKEATWSAPEHFSSPINSVSKDMEPTLSQDGLTMMFVSTRALGFKLFITQRESIDGKWSSPENLPWLNSAAWQGAPCILADATGSTVIYHSQEGLKVASRADANEVFAISEKLPGTEILGRPMAPSLWKDGRTLHYRRNDLATGAYDIWMSKRIKKSDADN